MAPVLLKNPSGRGLPQTVMLYNGKKGITFDVWKSGGRVPWTPCSQLPLQCGWQRTGSSVAEREIY